MQYAKDSDDNLLIDGYFREPMSDRVLPPEVNRIIATYYLKKYSARKIAETFQKISMIFLFYIWLILSMKLFKDNRLTLYHVDYVNMSDCDQHVASDRVHIQILKLNRFEHTLQCNL